MIEKILKDKREIYRIHISNALRSMALSVIGIYVPIYLLTLGYTLSEVILYFVVLHLAGLLWAFLVLSHLVERFGLVRVLKFYYLLEVLYFIVLYFVALPHVPYLLAAALGGLALFSYYVPLNILLLRHTKFDKMGSDLSTFFALPKVFSIAGPLLSALLIPFFGFWPAFVLAGMGLVLSYIPLIQIKKSTVKVRLDLKRAYRHIKKRKLLFLMEGFDNIIEESKWFWGIYVFLLIGTLSVPGIIGSLSALGGAIFTFSLGKHLNKGTHKPIFIASIALIFFFVAMIFVKTELNAYLVALGASFAMMLFLVSYFGMIYRTVKGQDEVEFIFLREIPTVLGRMVVFGSILLMVHMPQYFFIVPIVAIVCMVAILIMKKRSFAN